MAVRQRVHGGGRRLLHPPAPPDPPGAGHTLLPGQVQPAHPPLPRAAAEEAQLPADPEGGGRAAPDAPVGRLQGHLALHGHGGRHRRGGRPGLLVCSEAALNESERKEGVFVVIVVVFYFYFFIFFGLCKVCLMR